MSHRIAIARLPYIYQFSRPSEPAGKLVIPPTKEDIMENNATIFKREP
jgi:hypothetical protein